MKSIITIVLSCCSLALFAQTRGVVTVVKDSMIDSLIAKRIELNSSALNTGKHSVLKPSTIVSNMGYRVQIFYGSDRRKVYQEQSRFSSLYPALNTYITYKEPNYYLRVGDFRIKMEAQRLINELKSNFPTLYIFREKINAPSLDYSND